MTGGECNENCWKGKPNSWTDLERKLIRGTSFHELTTEPMISLRQLFPTILRISSGVQREIVE
jgi:hypothetical protein